MPRPEDSNDQPANPSVPATVAGAAVISLRSRTESADVWIIV
jgi:hypothetical protein